MSAATPPSMGVAPHDLAPPLLAARRRRRLEAKDRIWRVLCHDFFHRACPPAQGLLGKQMLVVGERPG
jgi:hypothetical protein